MSILDQFRLDGRVAVVTGGAKSIGMYYSTALLEAGASVVVADVDAAAVSETSARLTEEFPGKVLGVDLDVASRESIAAMVGRVEAQWGRLDVLVNNAALFTALPSRTSPWGIPEEEWARVMTTNVRSISDVTEACLPLMASNGWGRVVNIASALAFMGSPNLPHYAASKSAVVNLTYTLASALGSQGITVNAIAPGLTDSPSLLEKRGNSPNARTTATFSSRRSVARAEVPEDLLGTLIFLCSPASAFLTGQTLVVDGGMVLH